MWFLFVVFPFSVSFLTKVLPPMLKNCLSTIFSVALPTIFVYRNRGVGVFCVLENVLPSMFVALATAARQLNARPLALLRSPPTRRHPWSATPRRQPPCHQMPPGSVTPPHPRPPRRAPKNLVPPGAPRQASASASGGAHPARAPGPGCSIRRESNRRGEPACS